AHEARIAGKELRYLLEPLGEAARAGAAAKKAVKALKGLQDVLGELHDAHVLGHLLQEALVEAAAERARSVGAAVFEGKERPRTRDLRPGLLTVAEAVRDRRDRLYALLVERRPAVAELGADLRAVADGLAGPPPDVEIERKYLLHKLPKLDGAARA